MSRNGYDRQGADQDLGQSFDRYEGRPSARSARPSARRGSASDAPRGAAAIPAGQPQASANPYSRSQGGARYKKKGVTRRKVLIGAGIGLGAVVIGGVAWAASFVNSVGTRLNEGVDDETKAVLQDQQTSAQELTSNWTDMSPFYILLLGVDSMEERLEDEDEYGSDESAYRSDTIILTRVDPGNKLVTLVSIHRDTWCEEINNKINAYYSLGGASAVIEKISAFAGVPISHYAQVNIDALVAVTDALGGVEVDVPYEINDTEYMGHVNNGHLDAGLQTLNGEQAELFTRSRHAYDDMGDGDRYRAANQRLFIDACLKKLMASSPLDMVNVLNTAVNYITTDLTLDQIVNLALAMRGIDTSTGVYSTMNPTESEYVNGGWYEFNDDERWAQIMAAVDAGEKPPVDSDYVSVTDDINSASHGDAGKSLTEVTVSVRGCGGSTDYVAQIVSTLQGAGVNAYDAGDADLYLDATQVIYDDPLEADVASQIAALIGASASAAGSDWAVTAGADIMVVVGAA